MDILLKFLDLILHIDRYLDLVISYSGIWFYLILFIIIFCETGLVITPFFPGDSLLFACGAFSARGVINPYISASVILTAAVIGDAFNYHIGKFLGEKAVKKYPFIFKKEYIDRTHSFYEKYGGKTIIIARFIPIVRTFAPFLAGIGDMGYMRFMIYNLTGALIWVVFLLCAGYFFGNLDFVRRNFSYVIIAIIIISILPTVLEYITNRART
ncbi:MAG: DedA family protein [Elusimicrobiales bacterium]